MPEKHPKRPRDLNQRAKRMVDIAAGEVEDREPTPREQSKSAKAVARGRYSAALIPSAASPWWCYVLSGIGVLVLAFINPYLLFVAAGLTLAWFIYERLRDGYWS